MAPCRIDLPILPRSALRLLQLRKDTGSAIRWRLFPSAMEMSAMTSHLDMLEARTVYILREAFARLEPLGMLWSIGKDSNALLWMARKAFFGHAPFPLIQLDTEMELPEVYDFRDRLVDDWNLNLKVELCPPEEEMDPTLPPATRSAARKTEGLRALLVTGRLSGHHRGHPSGRTVHARQGTCVQPPPDGWRLGLPRSTARVLGSIQD